MENFPRLKLHQKRIFLINNVELNVHAYREICIMEAILSKTFARWEASSGVV